MRRSFIRLPLTSITQYFDRVTSAAPIIPTPPTSRRSSTSGAPPQIRGLELDRAVAPIDGCDYKHWLVVMDPPISYPSRHQIVERYIQTLASALGSEEEAKRSIYSVSTKYYYAFGCKIDDNVISSIKSYCSSQPCPMLDGFCLILISVMAKMIMEENHLLMDMLFLMMKCSMRIG
ncbi:multiple organellar RNA editing factor 7, mitochondrial isoform X2 [Lactuca sativa]|uniref:multiple organellar RNA editing factor 7, mitochondrial isoform X2 n=1 Tax=Lactuca sativa TaxID=4236 RepID=UPI000CD83559|nr:multiple organellar RNA editing factor 7, mitochondrial isoform X2 [Lactuca sativa]